MGDIKGTCRLEIVDNAVYLIFETPAGAEKASRVEVLKLIESMGIQDVDFVAIMNFFKEETVPLAKVKISDNTNIEVKDEKADIDISKNKMEAAITFKRAGYGGKNLTPDDIVKCLEKAGVRYGVNKKLVQSLFSRRQYDFRYVIAVGKNATDGENGYLDYKFDTSPKTKRPKVLDDGRVDFRDIGYFESAIAGQILAVLHSPTEGTPGYNVFGHPIKSKPGKPAPKLPKGKNTRIAANNVELVAEVSGQILHKNNKIDILPVLEIRDDVGPAVGNIDFAGSIIIHGNVKTSYSVIATGSIDIYGTVEGAYVEANENVNIYGGVQGMERANIISGADLFMRYAENATVSATGNIVADSIMHSTVKCDGGLYLEGRKCVIVGGKIIATKSIHAKVIGSTMSTVTDITTGHSAEHVEEFEALKKELASAKAEYNKYDKTAAAVLKMGDISSLPQDKKDLLVKIMHAKAIYRDKVLECQSKLSVLSLLLSSTNGEISVSNKIYAGARITIGNAIMHVRDDISSCTLKNIDGKITICSYTEQKSERKEQKKQKK